MIRVFRKTLMEKSVAAGVDEVIGHTWYPDDSKQNNVSGEVHIISGATTSILTMARYGALGVMGPMPESLNIAIDTSWDDMVDKDVEYFSSINYSPEGGGTSAAWDEPGSMDLNALLGQSSILPDNGEWFKRRKNMSFMSVPRGFVDASPDQYTPGDVFQVKSSRTIRAPVPSISMLGIGSPDWASVSTTTPSSPSSPKDWMIWKFMGMALESAFYHIMGLTETGAETPYEDTADALELFLEPPVFEEAADAFVSVNYRAFADMTWDVSVPGHLGIKTISSD